MIRFKHEVEARLKEEFFKLSPYLHFVIAHAHLWLTQRGYDMIVTCIYRSQAEQDALVAAKEAVDKVSVHSFYRGADIRLSFPLEEGAELVRMLNSKFVYDAGRPGIQTARIHQGTALHLHLQTRL